MSRLLAPVIAGVLAASLSSAQTIVPGGGASGGDALVIPNGDILNVRNIQGGTIADPNLDIGAGSTSHPGTLALNYDVGRRILVYDGHKHLLARFGPDGIVFYRRPKVRRSLR